MNRNYDDASRGLVTRRLMLSAVALAVGCWTLIAAFEINGGQAENYLHWSAAQAEAIGSSMRDKGRVGAGQGLIHTERSTSYKLRATWLTPDVIRAAARLLQLSDRLTDQQTKSLVDEAEAAGHTAVLVEIDPREGSGVIPPDWQAFFEQKGMKVGNTGPVTGINTPRLRNVKALAGVKKRDYDYDVFWIVFPLLNDKGEPIFSNDAREAEFVVRIYDKEGKVSWPIPDSIRRRINQLVMKPTK